MLASAFPQLDTHLSISLPGEVPCTPPCDGMLPSLPSSHQPQYSHLMNDVDTSMDNGDIRWDYSNYLLYGNVISDALQSSPSGFLTLDQIYRAVKRVLAKNGLLPGWQMKVRKLLNTRAFNRERQIKGESKTVRGSLYSRNFAITLEIALQQFEIGQNKNEGSAPLSFPQLLEILPLMPQFCQNLGAAGTKPLLNPLQLPLPNGEPTSGVSAKAVGDNSSMMDYAQYCNLLACHPFFAALSLTYPILNSNEVPIATDSNIVPPRFVNAQAENIMRDRTASKTSDHQITAFGISQVKDASRSRASCAQRPLRDMQNDTEDLATMPLEELKLARMRTLTSDSTSAGEFSSYSDIFIGELQQDEYMQAYAIQDSIAASSVWEHNHEIELARWREVGNLKSVIFT